MSRAGFAATEGSATHEAAVSNRASRAVFSRLAPRGRTLRTCGRARRATGQAVTSYPPGSRARDLFQDVRGLRGPDEGFGVFVVAVHVLIELRAEEGREAMRISGCS
jgi:hypothetical protein